MKPHEETWDNGRDFEVTVCGPELDRGVDAARERLARCAPDMARALLEAHATIDCACRRLKASPCFMAAALAKAGVLP